MICPYCEELENRKLPDEYKLGIDSRIIVETENFVVVPDISPLAPGHLLIIPKDHILSFGAVEEKNRSELNSLLSQVKKILSECYHRPLIMEHGSNKYFTGGACVIHAHLQVFPGDIDIKEALSCFNVQSISEFWELANWSQRGEPYVFLETLEGEMFVADHIDGIRKQFIRIEIGKRIGLLSPQWDWRWNLREGNKKELISTIQNTINTLKKAWRHL